MSVHNENESTPETPAPVGPESESAKKFMGLLEDIQRMHNELRAMLTSEKLYDQLVGGLSCHNNFILLVQNLVRETVAESIAQQDRLQDHHDHSDIVLADPPHVKGYRCLAADTRQNNAMIKACLLPSDHPTKPGELDIYVRQEGEDDIWNSATLPPLALSAIREALVSIAAQPNEYYWCDMAVITEGPINPDSRLEPAAEQESTDGPAAD